MNGRKAFLRGIARRSRRFADDERGSAAIENILWYGLFGALLMVVADSTTAFMANARMWHAAHDAARRVSLADMTGPEAEVYVRESLYPSMREGAVVTVTGGDTISVEVEVPVEAATVFGVVPGFGDGALAARVIMRDEIAAITKLNEAREQVAESGGMSGG